MEDKCNKYFFLKLSNRSTIFGYEEAMVKKKEGVKVRVKFKTRNLYEIG